MRSSAVARITRMTKILMTRLPRISSDIVRRRNNNAIQQELKAICVATIYVVYNLEITLSLSSPAQESLNKLLIKFLPHNDYTIKLSKLQIVAGL